MELIEMEVTFHEYFEKLLDQVIGSVLQISFRNLFIFRNELIRLLSTFPVWQTLRTPITNILHKMIFGYENRI